jgi:hypothetical protein
MAKCLSLFFLAAGLACGPATEAKDFKTNELDIVNGPSWLTQARVEKITNRIQYKLEWSTRMTKVFFYQSEADFAKAQSLGPMAEAVTEYANSAATVHIGPTVKDADLDAVLGHELVHVIIFQKYKDAIPKWFEEGLANHLAQRGVVDYKWLSKQDLPGDVRELAHPFSGSASMISFRYKASQAVAEMLDKKCGLDNLLRLSVQRKMENFVETYCEIKDINAAFKDWVKAKAKAGVAVPAAKPNRL